MSEDTSASPPDAAGQPDPLLVHITYGLYAVGFFSGITAIIGVVLAYVRRGDVRGTYLEGHFTYLIRTFWIGLLGGLASVLLMLIGIGFLLIFAVAIWIIYRIVKGWIALADGRPIPDPETWL